MIELKVGKAFAFAEMNGKKVLKKEVAKKLWPDSSEKSQMVNIAYLQNGRTKRISADQVRILCEELGVTPNFLFNYEE